MIPINYLLANQVMSYLKNKSFKNINQVAIKYIKSTNALKLEDNMISAIIKKHSHGWKV